MKHTHRNRRNRQLLIWLLVGTICYAFGCADSESYSVFDAPDAAGLSDMEPAVQDGSNITTDMFISDLGGTGLDGTTACPSMPPPPEMTGCFLWQCEQVSAPECWTCTATPVENGAVCTASDGTSQTCTNNVCSTTVQDPSEPGPHNVDTESVTINLGSWPSNDTVELNLFSPSGLSNRPVVVFHHGFLLSAQDYESYGQHFASWGYVVVMPNFTTSIFGGPTHTDLKGMLMALIDWIATHDEDETHPLTGKIEHTQLMLAGHSLGGKISFLTATEDPRVRGIMGVDPVDAQGGPFPLPETDYPSVTPELMNLIEVPSIVVGETTNAACEGTFCQACAPADNNFHQYYVHAAAAAVEVEVVGANHMSFLDNTNCGTACSACPSGTDDPLTTRRLTHGYLTAFLNVIFLNAEDYRPYLTGDVMPLDISSDLVILSNKNDF